jgi:hypothetical protein
MPVADRYKAFLADLEAIAEKHDVMLADVSMGGYDIVLRRRRRGHRHGLYVSDGAVCLMTAMERPDLKD